MTDQNSTSTPQLVKNFRGKPLQITKDDSITEPQLALDSVIFNDWWRDMEKDTRLGLKGLHLQNLDKFGKRVGFIKFSADVSDLKNPDRFVPGIVFMRGGAVSMLLIITSQETKEEYVLLTMQPRIPIARSSAEELPAGMLDGRGGASLVAEQEMREETGLTISSEHFIDMTELAYGDKETTGVPGVYPSCGGCDEFLRLFVYRTTMPQSELNRLEGKDILEDGENITLKVRPLKDLWKCNDAKALCSLALYNNLREKIEAKERERDIHLAVTD